MASQYIPDQLRGHADEADGIQEYDNKLPTWWVGLFIFTIIWGAVEFVDWHVTTPRSLAAAYNEARAAALAAAGPAIDISTIEIEMSPEAIAAGAEVFQSTCAACHSADGSGGVGANLLDAEWIHGNDFVAIRQVVAGGVLDKGMPAWLPVIGADGLANVVAYVIDLSPTAVDPRDTPEPVAPVAPTGDVAAEGSAAGAIADPAAQSPSAASNTPSAPPEAAQEEAPAEPATPDQE